MPLNKKFLGIEIGGTKLQLAVADGSGNIEEHFRYAINPSEGAGGIIAQVTEGLQRLNGLHNIAAIGVGFGGPVDWKNGAVCVSHQVNGWEDFHLSSWLQELTKKPVVIENDANVAALAEAVYGCGNNYERVFYITIGSGIGGGMIVNGDIYHGRSPGEVEVGHLKMDKSGVTLEAKCSGWAVNKKIRDYIHENPGSRLSKMVANSLSPEATLLKPALEENDDAAKKIIEEIADDLSFALSHVAHLFHPDIIVIGGGLSLLNEHLCIPVEERLSHYIMKAFLPAPPVLIAALGENVVPVGAAEIAKKNWLKIQKFNS
jgi:glucokinase